MSDVELIEQIFCIFISLLLIIIVILYIVKSRELPKMIPIDFRNTSPTEFSLFLLSVVEKLFEILIFSRLFAISNRRRYQFAKCSCDMLERLLFTHFRRFLLDISRG
jgi:hypothetical protein